METLNYLLGYKDYYIYQDTEMFNFSLDSVLLPNFITVRKKIEKIMDIGCGNAPIPLILSTKTKAQIYGVEIQKESYDLAIKSVKKNCLEHQINIINADINEIYKQFESDSFDIITCNPPFFKTTETSKFNKNDYKSLARHEIALNLDQLFNISKYLLKNGGNVGVVHRTDRLIEIITKMKENNIEPKRIQFVYPKQNSQSNIVLIEGTKNGRPGLKIEHPLFVHYQNGEYTEEVKKYFE